MQPVLQPHPGATTTFSFFDNLATATTTLDESTDVDRTALSETQVSVSVKEQGLAVGLTAKLRATGLVDVDGGAENVVAWNAIDSLDEIARDVVSGGTNVEIVGQSARADLTASDTLDSANVRLAVNKLRRRSAAPRRGGNYVAYIHPDVALDLMAETGKDGWRESHIYASPETIYAGEIGAYEGAVFVQTPRAKIDGDGGSGTVDAYRTVFCAQQGLAKAVAIEPHIVQSPVTDRLRRLPGIGWYALLGYGRFREEALQRVESASSVGDNS